MTLHTNEEKQTSMSVPDCEEVLRMNYLFIKELDNRTVIIFFLRNVNKKVETFDHSYRLDQVVCAHESLILILRNESGNAA